MCGGGRVCGGVCTHVFVRTHTHDAHTRDTHAHTHTHDAHAQQECEAGEGALQGQEHHNLETLPHQYVTCDV